MVVLDGNLWCDFPPALAVPGNARTTSHIMGEICNASLGMEYFAVLFEPLIGPPIHHRLTEKCGWILIPRLWMGEYNFQSLVTRWYQVRVDNSFDGVGYVDLEL